MALLSYSAVLVGLSGCFQAQLPVRYSHAVLLGLASAVGRDWRIVAPTDGIIANNNRVMHKASESAPELPFAGARVRVHRLSDGYLAWQGTSDAQGWYHPRGLEVGEKYYPVAIDLTGQHECSAAGPVLATVAA